MRPGIMTRFEITDIPGVGRLHTLLSQGGEWIGVLQLRGGRCQLFVDDPADPDARRLVADLSPSDSQALAELLGGVHPRQPEDLGPPPVVEWMRVPEASRADQKKIHDLRLREQTGAAVVAILRGDTHNDPSPDFRLQPGDILVLTGGKKADLQAARTLLHTKVTPDQGPS